MSVTDEQQALVRESLEAVDSQVRFALADLDRDEFERVVSALQTISFMAGAATNALHTAPAVRAAGPAMGATKARVRRRTRVDGKVLHPAILDLIREKGEPMEPKEIMQGLRDKNIPVPGQGRPANVIAHLSRMPEILKTDYGKYGLAVWGEAEMLPVRPAEDQS